VGLNWLCWSLSSIISFSTEKTLLSMQITGLLPILQTGYSGMKWDPLTLSQIIPKCSHVDESVYSLFDSTSWRVFFPFSHSQPPICGCWRLSHGNLPCIDPWDIMWIHDLSEKPGIGITWAIALALLSIMRSSVLQLNTEPGFTFWEMHLYQAHAQAPLVLSSELHVRKLKCEEGDCI